jgi:hypothetical protein
LCFCQVFTLMRLSSPLFVKLIDFLVYLNHLWVFSISATAAASACMEN